MPQTSFTWLNNDNGNLENSVYFSFLCPGGDFHILFNLEGISSNTAFNVSHSFFKDCFVLTSDSEHEY